MRAVFTPSAPSGSVEAPPSKSVAHRLLICAGLSGGTNAVSGIAPSEDVSATLDCLSALGAKIRLADGVAKVYGADPRRARSATLPCRESGSTLRFFLPLCLLSGKEFTLTGSETLLSRPLSVYENLAREKGFSFAKRENAVTVKGKLTPGEYVVSGNVSSQFVSGLLFALPLLDGDSTIRLLPPIESKSYLDLTVSALADYGVTVVWTDETTILVPGGQRYLSHDSTVEGDWSNAAAFLSLGVPVTGLRADSLQGDRRVVEYLRELDRGKAEIDLADCPDLAPVLFAHAALRHGGRFTGTRRLAVKESDRGRAMQEELAKCGVTVTVGENEIDVGCGAKAPDKPFSGHNDHRIVMACTVIAARLGGIIDGVEAVRKSYPDFFKQLQNVNIKVDTDYGMDFKK